MQTPTPFDSFPGILSQLHSQLGVMTWPLTIMSLITAIILVERIIYMLLNSRTQTFDILSKIHHLDFNQTEDVERFVKQELAGRSLMFQSMRMLLNHRHFPKQLREEAVSIWLFKKRQQFRSGIRILSLIGMISPLIGLLGTVMGLMEMFKGLSLTSNVNPATLADGLGLAMSTTAAGLIIAVPAITGAQFLNMWVDRTLSKIEYTLNHSNLHIEGIYVEAMSNEKQSLGNHQSEDAGNSTCPAASNTADSESKTTRFMAQAQRTSEVNA
ncbi:MotA/TolQ/ExbB proton channel family protein [Vibrio ulleungensis]|uniref:MotA/TolQ/ExbB proton channel family protein n=1 Tax=Vibrio ulleungensis TaxID=2807619 RepID=A0ABS2HJE3_9VIBR|nr:MotA/TolQ/ExbB proton channel family protein [Vibrio ulleungensis]MBM7037144.1 MotA/TolQ/ExbB proton channel family protein [Vibrio ulleungensis]